MTRPGSEEDAGEGQQLRLARPTGRAPPASSSVSRPCGQRAEPRAQSPARRCAVRMRSSGMVGVEEGQVVAHAGAEELHVLRDHADAPAQVRQPRVAHVDAAQAPMQMLPLLGSYRRNSRRVSVVLPLPVRPSRPSTWPGATRNDTSSSTGRARRSRRRPRRTRRPARRRERGRRGGRGGARRAACWSSEPARGCARDSRRPSAGFETSWVISLSGRKMASV